jgi:hypothetical protein
MPLNPAFQNVLKTWLTMGEIQEAFFGKTGASKDPELAFYNDQGWLQWYQIKKLAQPQSDAQIDSINIQNKGQAMQVDQMAAQDQNQLDPNISTVDEGVNQLSANLGKNERILTPNNKKLLAQQKMLTRKVVGVWEDGSRQMMEDLKKILLKNKGNK